MVIKPNRGRRRLAWLVRLLAAAACVIATAILTGSHGLARLGVLRAELDQRGREVYQRSAENRRLIERIARLETDDRVLEETARSKLGMVAEDELIFVFPVLPRAR